MKRNRSGRLVTKLAFGVSALLGSASQAQEDSVNPTQHFARAFVGFCAQSTGNNDKVVAAANALGFKELEGDMKAMVAPQDPNAEYAGWLVEDEGQMPLLLGISEAEMKGVQYSNCVVANPNVPMDEVLEELQRLISFGNLLHEEEAMGQRYRIRETSSVAERSFISVMDAPAMGIEGGTLSLSAPSLQKE